MADPYVTWSEVASAVKGDKRLRDLLLPLTETADAHPFFDEQAAAASQIADAELERGGYAVPLDAPLEDVQLRNAVIGVLIGLLTISNSNREAWMEKLEAAGYAWLAKIGDGEVTVIGASTDSTDEIAAGAGTFHGTEIDDPVFDIGDPRASVLDVFPSLTLPRTRSR
jgi:hypothetical protein